MKYFLAATLLTLMGSAALAKGQLAISTLSCSNASKNLKIEMQGKQTGPGQWDDSAKLQIQIDDQDITDGRVVNYQIQDGWRNIPSLDIHQVEFYSNKDQAMKLEILMLQDGSLREQNFYSGKLILKRGIVMDKSIPFICRIVR